MPMIAGTTETMEIVPSSADKRFWWPNETAKAAVETVNNMPIKYVITITLNPVIDYTGFISLVTFEFATYVNRFTPSCLAGKRSAVADNFICHGTLDFPACGGVVRIAVIDDRGL